MACIIYYKNLYNKEIALSYENVGNVIKIRVVRRTVWVNAHTVSLAHFP